MKYVFWIAVALILILAVWRIVQPSVANVQLQDDVRDAAAQIGWHTGLKTLDSDDDLRTIIIDKARKHGIVLEPDQITVRHSGTERYPVWMIAVDYRVKVNLLVYSYALRFKPVSNEESPFWGTLDSERPQSPAPNLATPKSAEPKPAQPPASRQPPELRKIPESLKQPMSR